MKNEIIVWRPPPIEQRLMENQTHVWCAALDLDDERLKRMQQVLSPDERERADRFHFKRHRRRFIVGRSILRNVLSRYLNTDPRSIDFRYSYHGKPSLKHQPVKGNLFFNLSHSHELALYAIAHRPLVGIDVEHIRPMPDVEGMAKNLFFPGEYKKICAMAEDEKYRAFFHYWTCKEAYIKAIGSGLSDLKKIEVSFDSRGKVSLINRTESDSNKKAWLITQIKPKTGYTAALALSGRHRQLNFFLSRDMKIAEPCLGVTLTLLSQL